DYTLDHKYTRNEGRIYLSGVQALVKLPLMQRLRDAHEGIDSLTGPAMTSTAQLTSPSSTDLIDRDYTLDHKYTRNEGRIYLSGVQALVKLPLMQRLR
ncbi:hypothetical protein C7E12_19885, partial [Stenotrophomonas maltophilia]